MIPALNGASVGVEGWADYKAVFQYFSEKVRTLQRLSANPGVTRAEIEAAVLAVEKARISYSRARDTVAQPLLNSSSRSVFAARLEPSPASTSEVAELLWECAGRPEGTAEADWHSAEKIIQLARAPGA